MTIREPHLDGATAFGSDGARTFAFFTSAGAFEVWSALTDHEQTTKYLYGMSLHSEWVPDAEIQVRVQDQVPLQGQVLCAWPHRRLSYFLHAPDASPVYLTWLIRPHPSGAVCRLTIDEAEEGDGSVDLEDVWLPILDALQRHLASRPA